MSKNSSISDSTLVDEYIQKLEPKMSVLAEATRQLILNTDNEIAEQIKWNVPSFYYSGEIKPFDPKEYKRDLLVTNFRQKDHLLLVMPSGAKLNDSSGLLEGDYKDGRRLIKIYDLADLKNKEKKIKKVIKDWLKLIEK